MSPKLTSSRNAELCVLSLQVVRGAVRFGGFDSVAISLLQVGGREVEEAHVRLASAKSEIVLGRGPTLNAFPSCASDPTTSSFATSDFVNSQVSPLSLS